jgi:hypothetical protein
MIHTKTITFARGAIIAALAMGSLLAGGVLNAAPLPGAIFTTDSTCSGVDLNIYASKDDVYIDGGPAHPGAAGLPAGSYYVQVTDPSGATLLGTSIGSGNETPFVVDANGEPVNCYQLSAILIKGSDATPGYDDTTNPGGEYKVWVSTVSTFDNDSTKTDNFKVRSDCADRDKATLCVTKFYDANANGIQDNGEQDISGWRFSVFADDNLLLMRKTPRCMVVDAGTYHVIESTPLELDWVHTTATDVQVILPEYGSQNVTFGNVCLGAGGGLTLGFWSNKNGQKLETAADFTLLTSLNLVDANGNAKNFTSSLTVNKTDLNKWLLGANATNMAYMLSAQLTAMELNVSHSFVSGSALVYAPSLLGVSCGSVTVNVSPLGFISINDLMTASNNILGATGGNLTKDGSPLRDCEEKLKTALDNANNNLNFTQSSPCPFSFGN